LWEIPGRRHLKSGMEYASVPQVMVSIFR
jgi:hypothetical protein